MILWHYASISSSFQSVVIFLITNFFFFFLYIYSLHFRNPSHLGHHKAPDRVPSAVCSHQLSVLYRVSIVYGLPWCSHGKESACSAGDLASIPGSGRSPGGGHGNPLQYSCLENPHGQRSLVGYSQKELDTTERLSTA